MRIVDLDAGHGQQGGVEIQIETTAIEIPTHECGFANPSAFSKAFSKRFGITPKRYR